MQTLLKTTFALLAFITLTVSSRSDEEKIALDKLPKAVTDTVKKRFPKAELVEAAKETEKDKVEYEVTIKDGDTKIDVMLTPEGVITLIEKSIAAKDLPKAVTKTLDEKYPKAKYLVAEEVIKIKDGKEALDFYEVLLEVEKKKIEVKITAEGKITETEEKKGDDK